jgi:hypothetical protein
MRFVAVILLAAAVIAFAESRRPEPAGLPEELQDPGPLTPDEEAMMRDLDSMLELGSQEDVDRWLEEAVVEFDLDTDAIRREARERLSDRLLQDAAEDAGFY